jgi:hypothetical protein
MSYHIPNDEQVVSALKKVFKKYRTVNSQNRLRKLVIQELNTKKKKFGVSESRLRNLAIKSDFVKLELPHTGHFANIFFGSPSRE